MTFREVTLAITGLRDRDEMFESMFRGMTTIIASTNFGGKGVAGRMKKMWPMKRDALNVSGRNMDVLKKFREGDAKLIAKNKIDGRRSKTNS